MEAADYVVSGVGPAGDTFSETTASDPLTLEGLATGEWTVSVQPRNDTQTAIGSGEGVATVEDGQTAEVSITVVPLEGVGSLDLEVGWTEGELSVPSIHATLTTAAEVETTLELTLGTAQGTHTSSTIPAGYYTLALELREDGDTVAGAVEVVRIVAGQTTTGSFTFTDLGGGQGSLVVSISLDLADPIELRYGG